MHRILLFFLAIGLAGCATTTDHPTPLQLTITVAENANPDDSGRASPVVLGIFDLAQPAQFRNADYLALLAAPRKKLHTDLLNIQRTPAIAPGSQYELALNVDKDARFIGVVAELVQFTKTANRIVVPIKNGRANNLELIVNAYGITATEDEPKQHSKPSRFNDD